MIQTHKPASSTVVTSAPPGNRRHDWLALGKLADGVQVATVQLPRTLRLQLPGRLDRIDDTAVRITDDHRSRHGIEHALETLSGNRRCREIGRHPVEGLGQDTKFVTPPDPDPRAEMALPQAQCSAVPPANRAVGGSPHQEDEL